MRVAFSRFAERVARLSGHYLAFLACLVSTGAWIVLMAWEWKNAEIVLLVGNSVMTTYNFLQVILVQNTQLRGDAAMQLKLNELIRKLPQPDTALAGIEDRMEG